MAFQGDARPAKADCKPSRRPSRAPQVAVRRRARSAVQLHPDAVEQGFDLGEHGDSDTNLKSLREYPPYQQLQKPKQ